MRHRKNWNAVNECTTMWGGWGGSERKEVWEAGEMVQFKARRQGHQTLVHDTRRRYHGMTSEKNNKKGLRPAIKYDVYVGPQTSQPFEFSVFLSTQRRCTWKRVAAERKEGKQRKWVKWTHIARCKTKETWSGHDRGRGNSFLVWNQSVSRNSPEGRSSSRSCWRPWKLITQSFPPRSHWTSTVFLNSSVTVFCSRIARNHF